MTQQLIIDFHEHQPRPIHPIQSVIVGISEKDYKAWQEKKWFRPISKDARFQLTYHRFELTVDQLPTAITPHQPEHVNGRLVYFTLSAPNDPEQHLRLAEHVRMPEHWPCQLTCSIMCDPNHITDCDMSQLTPSDVKYLCSPAVYRRLQASKLPAEVRNYFAQRADSIECKAFSEQSEFLNALFEHNTQVENLLTPHQNVIVQIAKHVMLTISGKLVAQQTPQHVEKTIPWSIDLYFAKAAPKPEAAIEIDPVFRKPPEKLADSIEFDDSVPSAFRYKHTTEPLKLGRFFIKNDTHHCAESFFYEAKIDGKPMLDADKAEMGFILFKRPPIFQPKPAQTPSLMDERDQFKPTHAFFVQLVKERMPKDLVQKLEEKESHPFYWKEFVAYAKEQLGKDAFHEWHHLIETCARRFSSQTRATSNAAEEQYAVYTQGTIEPTKDEVIELLIDLRRITPPKKRATYSVEIDLEYYDEGKMLISKQMIQDTITIDPNNEITELDIHFHSRREIAVQEIGETGANSFQGETPRIAWYPNSTIETIQLFTVEFGKLYPGAHGTIYIQNFTISLKKHDGVIWLSPDDILHNIAFAEISNDGKNRKDVSEPQKSYCFEQKALPKKYAIKVLRQQIKDLPNDAATLQFDVSFDAVIVQDPQPISSEITLEAKVNDAFKAQTASHFCYTIDCPLETQPNTEQLVIDWGTSAIVAKHTVDLVDDSEQSLIDLQASFGDQVGIPEHGTRFLSSLMFLRQSGDLQSSTYEESVLTFVTSPETFLERRQYILPYLKRLLGMKDLKDWSDRLGEYAYFDGKEGCEYGVTDATFPQIEALSFLPDSIKDQLKAAFTEKRLSRTGCEEYLQAQHDWELSDERRQKVCNALAIPTILFKNRPLEVKKLVEEAYTILLRDFIIPQITLPKKSLQPIIFAVPNTFTPAHEEWICDALLKNPVVRDTLGLKKEQIRFVSESTAVAWYYLSLRPERPEDEYVLVYDMGAGTLDLTYLKIHPSEPTGAGEQRMYKKDVHILGTFGQADTSGNYLDYAIAEAMAQKRSERYCLTEKALDNIQAKLDPIDLQDDPETSSDTSSKTLSKYTGFLKKLDNSIFKNKQYNSPKAFLEALTSISDLPVSLVEKYQSIILDASCSSLKNLLDHDFTTLHHLKTHIRDTIKPLLTEASRQKSGMHAYSQEIALPREKFSEIYLSSNDNGKQDNETIIQMTIDELVHSDPIKEFFRQNTEVVFEHFFTLHNKFDEREYGKHEFPIDTVILSGRSTLWQELSTKIERELDTWRDQRRTTNYQGLQKATDPKDPNELLNVLLWRSKSAVAHGATRYAMLERLHDITFHDKGINAYYGIIYLDPPATKYLFKKILGPDNELNQDNPFCAATQTIDLRTTPRCYFVQSYADEAETAKDYNAGRRGSITEIGFFNINLQDEGLEFAQVTVSMNLKRELRISIDIYETAPEIPTQLDVQDTDQFRKSMWPYFKKPGEK